MIEESGTMSDPMLSGVPFVDGYKVLGGVAIYQKLGQGGMGAVYRGRHIRLNSDVAVKVMAPPPGLSDEGANAFIKRFVREAQTTASINHPNLVRVMDVNAESGLYYIIMDYVDGETAGQRLERKGRLSEREVIEICTSAAEGLADAHERGIVHRDVKPDNILIDKRGRVTVVDLGLAKAYSTGEKNVLLTMGISMSEQAMGTPWFMSPEQTHSAKDVGPPADVWSLGVTMFYLFTGRQPWCDKDFSDLIQKIRSHPLPDIRENRPDISERARKIIEKALRKEAAERYAHCGEMAAALAEHLSTITTTSGTALADTEAGSTTQLQIIAPPPDRDALARMSDSIGNAMRPRTPPSHLQETLQYMPETAPQAYGGSTPGTVPVVPLTGQAGAPSSGLRLPLVLAITVGLFAAFGAGYLLLDRSDRDSGRGKDSSQDALALRARQELEDRARRDAEVKKAAEAERKARVALLLATAVTFRETGLLDKACDSLAKVLEILPNHAEAKRSLIEIQAELVGTKTEKERAASYRRWTEEGLKLKLGDKIHAAGQAYAKAAEYAPPGSSDAADAAVACFHEHYRSGAAEARGKGEFVRAAELYRKALQMKSDAETRRALAEVQAKVDALNVAEAGRAEVARLILAAKEAERRDDFKAALRDYLEAKKLGADVAKKITSLEGEIKYREMMARARALADSKTWKESVSTLKAILETRAGDEAATRLLAEVKKHLAAAPFLAIDLGDGITLKLIYVKPIRFVMGSNKGESDERPGHEVTLTGFYMGKYEVTQAQYERITGKTPSQFRGANRPVERVSWNDAVAFCKALSARAGREFRLPTEAEWECACRAGSTRKYCFREDESLSDYAWYGKSGLTSLGGRTHDVGQKRPNAWGIHDVHGNVWEWCSDWYSATYYRSSPRADPKGPDSGRYRTARGGSWSTKFQGSCRSANREKKGPKLRSAEVGFRVVSPVEPD